ncbi:MAG: FMN-binding protein [Candidatus Neomarinimicrobiota bacterium]
MQAITGATITSRAVVKIINDALKQARSDYQSSFKQVS